MRGGIGGRAVVRMVVLSVAVAMIVGCGGPAPEPTSVPTFPTASDVPGPSAVAGPGGGSIPDDCAQLLSAADLGALLGLPLDSVEVGTMLGVAQPSVGRTERVVCRYTGIGSVRGRKLLDLNVSAYSDEASAARQWRRNAEVEDGDRRELPIGAASAVYVERTRESLLMVVHGSGNLTFVLPAGPLPGERSRTDVLLDLALRVLPVLPSPARPAPAPAPAPAPVDAAQASDSSF